MDVRPPSPLWWCKKCSATFEAIDRFGLGVMCLQQHPNFMYSKTAPSSSAVVIVTPNKSEMPFDACSPAGDEPLPPSSPSKSTNDGATSESSQSSQSATEEWETVGLDDDDDLERIARSLDSDFETIESPEPTPSGLLAEEANATGDDTFSRAVAAAESWLLAQDDDAEEEHKQEEFSETISKEAVAAAELRLSMESEKENAAASHAITAVVVASKPAELLSGSPPSQLPPHPQNSVAGTASHTKAQELFGIYTTGNTGSSDAAQSCARDAIDNAILSARRSTEYRVVDPVGQLARQESASDTDTASAIDATMNHSTNTTQQQTITRELDAIRDQRAAEYAQMRRWRESGDDARFFIGVDDGGRSQNGSANTDEERSHVQIRLQLDERRLTALYQAQCKLVVVDEAAQEHVEEEEEPVE